MSATPDGADRSARAASPDAHEAIASSSDRGPQRILIVEADAALIALLDEWLTACGCAIVTSAGEERAHQPCDLIIADIAFPRRGGSDVLKRALAAHPGVPVLALSGNFFAGVQGSGALAQALGVSAVLAKPVTRNALLAEVRRLLPERA
jgi:CheY-like chemotaxis protein